MKDISTISVNIASAVEEQSCATKEISNLVQHVSDSAEQINTNVEDLNQGVGETSHQAQELQALFEGLQDKVNMLDADSDRFIALLEESE